MKEFFVSIRQGKRSDWLNDNGKIALRKFREAGIVGEAKLSGAELCRAISQVFPDSVVLDDQTCENARPDFGGTDWGSKRDDIRERAKQMEKCDE